MKKRIAKKISRSFLHLHYSKYRMYRARDFWYRKSNKYTGYGLRYKGDRQKFLKYSNLYIVNAAYRHDIDLANKIDGIQCNILDEIRIEKMKSSLPPMKFCKKYYEGI